MSGLWRRGVVAHAIEIPPFLVLFFDILGLKFMFILGPHDIFFVFVARTACLHFLVYAFIPAATLTFGVRQHTSCLLPLFLAFCFFFNTFVKRVFKITITLN